MVCSSRGMSRGPTEWESGRVVGSLSMSMSGTDAARARRFPRALRKLSRTPQPTLARGADPGAMSSKIRKIAVIVGAGSVLAVAGCGSTTSSSSTAAPAGAAQQQQAGAPAAADLSALAKKLGVSTARLQEAMQATRPSQGASGSAATDPAAALAKELGLSAAKVRAAMQATRPSGTPQAPPSGSAPPSGAAPSSSSSTTSSS